MKENGNMRICKQQMFIDDVPNKHKLFFVAIVGLK